MQQFRVEVCTLLVAGLLFLVPASRASELGQAEIGKWPRSLIVLSISTSLLNAPNIQGDSSDTLQRSIGLWSRAAEVRIELRETDIQSVSAKGFRGDGVSLITAASTAENVRLFPKQADSPAAATRIFTDRRGNITEADIVLNPFVKFSTDGTFGTFDLQSTITHEIGHLLGLDHSPIWGSVMFAKSGASFGPATFASKGETLPEADAAAIRALYGAPAEDGECCGVAIGSVAVTRIPTEVKVRNVSVWLEETATGRIVAASAVSDDGRYELGGIRDGSYRLRVAGEFGEALAASDEEIIQISTADIVRKDFKLLPAKILFTADLFGTSPQIGRLPGVVGSGDFQSLFIGGKRLDIEAAKVSISGTDISIVRDAFRFNNYGEAVKVISFELPLAAGLANGEYSVLIEDDAGNRRFLPGALIVSN